MRGKISDQDLTDYALNELEPADRLYLESMLAVSEECRNDVYKVIDLAQLIEDGFEREGGEVQVLCLRPEQRAELTRPHFTARYVLRDFVLIRELQSLCLDVVLMKRPREIVDTAMAAD